MYTELNNVPTLAMSAIREQKMTLNLQGQTQREALWRAIVELMKYGRGTMACVERHPMLMKRKLKNKAFRKFGRIVHECMKKKESIQR